MTDSLLPCGFLRGRVSVGTPERAGKQPVVPRGTLDATGKPRCSARNFPGRIPCARVRRHQDGAARRRDPQMNGEKKSRLGRGLEALVGGADVTPPSASRQEIPLAAIEKNPYQPRKAFDDDELTS